jgi:hypothetical protein
MIDRTIAYGNNKYIIIPYQDFLGYPNNHDWNMWMSGFLVGN